MSRGLYRFILELNRLVGYRSSDIDKIVLEMNKLHKFFMDSPILGVETEFIDDGLVS